MVSLNHYHSQTDTITVTNLNTYVEGKMFGDHLLNTCQYCIWYFATIIFNPHDSFIKDTLNVSYLYVRKL